MLKLVVVSKNHKPRRIARICGTTQLEVKTSVGAVGRAALCRSLKISKKSRPSPWRGNEIHVCKMTDDHTGKPVWLFVYLALVCFTHLLCFLQLQNDNILQCVINTAHVSLVLLLKCGKLELELKPTILQPYYFITMSKTDHEV